jgi:hypothetical protein
MSGSLSTVRLRGRRVFLSASVPSPLRAKEFRRSRDAAVSIPEAVISLTRAVLTHGGQLVMGAHPTISPLVAQVAAEYWEPEATEGERVRERGEGRGANTPIVIYQSRAFEGMVSEATLLLERAGHARIQWIDRLAGESVKHGSRKPFAPESLAHMRKEMLRTTRPNAMVCIGGMEARLFAEMVPEGRIYALSTTGGAAELLSNEANVNGLRAIDRELMAELESVEREHPPAHDRVDEAGAETRGRDSDEPEEKYVPYPLIAQVIVEEIAGMTDGPRIDAV